MPRLFSAIDIGPVARQRIAAEQQRLTTALDTAALRWVKPEHVHLTLVFFGEVADDSAARLIEVMREPIAQPPFRLELGGFGIFPPRGVPRVLWLGVRSGIEDVIAVRTAVAGRCAALGFHLDRRRFHPHLTLARWRNDGTFQRPCELLANRDIVATADVNAITLFQSRLFPDGPIHTVLAESHLSAAGLSPAVTDGS